MTTLLYAGAGYDPEIMNYLKYDKYIFYDSLPNMIHYTEGQAGYEHTKNEEVFLLKLKDVYGDYDVIGYNELYFSKYNLTYFYNTDANDIKTLPKGDILIRGYCCDNWDLTDRNVFISCDTVNDINIKDVIHFCDKDDDCFYDEEEDEEETDEEEEETDEEEEEI